MSASTASASSGRTHGSHTDGVAALAASIGGGTLPSLVRHEIRALILPLLAPPGEHECRQSTRTTWLCLFLCGGRELATDSRVLQRRATIVEFGATRARSAGKKHPITRAQRVSDSSKRDGRATIGWQVGSKAMACAILLGGSPNNLGPSGGDTS